MCVLMCLRARVGVLVCACVCVCVCICGLLNLFQHFRPSATRLYIMFCELIQSSKANFKKEKDSLLLLLEAKKKKSLVVKSTSS